MTIKYRTSHTAGDSEKRGTTTLSEVARPLKTGQFCVRRMGPGDCLKSSTITSAAEGKFLCPTKIALSEVYSHKN